MVPLAWSANAAGHGAVTISRNDRSRCRHGTLTTHFGETAKSVTIDRNGRSRYSGIVGHDPPE